MLKDEIQEKDDHFFHKFFVSYVSFPLKSQSQKSSKTCDSRVNLERKPNQKKYSMIRNIFQRMNQLIDHESPEGNTGFSSWRVVNLNWSLSCSLLLVGWDWHVNGLGGLQGHLLLSGLLGHRFLDGSRRSVVPAEGEVAFSSWCVVDFDGGGAVGMLWEIHILIIIQIKKIVSYLYLV